MSKTVADLLENLIRLDPSLPVYVMADHGQTNTPVYAVSVEYVDEDKASVHPDDIDENDNLELAVIIWG